MSEPNMNDISKMILANDAKIEHLIKPAQFILNTSVCELLEDNKKIRSQCTHEYDEYGVCIYCHGLKDEVEEQTND